LWLSAHAVPREQIPSILTLVAASLSHSEGALEKVVAAQANNLPARDCSGILHFVSPDASNRIGCLFRWA
jgi:hypothetical protein